MNCFRAASGQKVRVPSLLLSASVYTGRLSKLPCPRLRDTWDLYSFVTGILSPEGWHLFQRTGAQISQSAKHCHSLPLSDLATPHHALCMECPVLHLLTFT